MKTNFFLYTWLKSLQTNTKKLFLIAFLGFFNGLGFLLFSGFLQVGNPSKHNDIGVFLLVAFTTGVVWLVANFLMRPVTILIISAVYYLSLLIYWIYIENQPGLSSILVRGHAPASFFLFVGFLIVVMSLVNYFVFSRFGSFLMALSLFETLVFSYIAPSLLNPENGFYTDLLNLAHALFAVLLISTLWVALSEFLISIIYEFSKKVVICE